MHERAGADDHRRARSGRRLHQLLARDLVLGDLDLRARRRRPARRARREPGDRRAHDRDPRAGRAPRRRRVCARRSVTRIEDAVIALSGYPDRRLPWKQFRALGCASLMLCDVAAGGLDGLIDSAPNLAPWDYLGGYLACVEAGAVVRDANGDELVTDDPTARRQVIARRHRRARRRARCRRKHGRHEHSISTRCSSPPTTPRAPAARSCARTSARRPTCARRRPATG